MQPLTSATSAGVTLSFGVVNVLVSVHSAVGEDTSRSLRTVCTHDHPATPIKQYLQCPVVGLDGKPCGNQHGLIKPFEKAKESDDGGLVVISADLIAQEKEQAKAFTKSINLTVHPLDEVTSVLMPSGKSYYLSMKSQNAGQREGYTYLSRMIAENPDRAFMCKFALRSAVSLFQLTTAGPGTLVLRQMAEAALVREHPSIQFMDLDEGDVALANRIVAHKTTPFLVAEHGTGTTSIIAEYAASQTPVRPVEVDGVVAPVAAAGGLDLRSQLEAMLTPATPITTPTKASVARKARTPRKTAAPKAS